MTALVALPIAAVQSGAPLAPVFSAYQVESLPFHTKSNRWILNEFTLLGRVCCDSNSSVRFVNMTKASFNVILTSICVNCRFLIVVLYMQCILAILLVVGVKLVPHFSPHHKYGKTTEQKQNRKKKNHEGLFIYIFSIIFLSFEQKKDSFDKTLSTTTWRCCVFACIALVRFARIHLLWHCTIGKKCFLNLFTIVFSWTPIV